MIGAIENKDYDYHVLAKTIHLFTQHANVRRFLSILLMRGTERSFDGLVDKSFG